MEYEEQNERGKMSIEERLAAQEEKIDKIYRSVEKTRKMILWSGIATIVTFLLPFIILIFMLPRALELFTGGIGLGGGIEEVHTTLQNGGGESLSELLEGLQNL